VRFFLTIYLQLSLADIQVFVLVEQAPNLGYGAVVDKFPDLKAHHDLVKSNKQIAAWLDKRPATTY